MKRLPEVFCDIMFSSKGLNDYSLCCCELKLLNRKNNMPSLDHLKIFY